MRILLDNCVPYQLKTLFVGHEVVHASDVGFSNLQNGILIAQAALRFDVLVTTDKKIRHEHNLAKLVIPIIELNTRFTRFDDLQRLAPHFESALGATHKYRFVSLPASGKLELLGETIS